MEHWIPVLITITFFLSCTEENACLKSAGDPVEYTVYPNSFDNLELHNSIEIELIQHKDTLIKITTGENLKNFISVGVSDQTLIIKDNNKCNWMREYDKTAIKIYHPNISSISHFGSNRIFSSDTLYYPDISLFSKNHPGDFDLIVNNNKIKVNINDVSNVYLSGKTSELFAGVYSGDGRIEAQNLIATKVAFFHRGTNDILVHPLNMLQGELVGLGNTIYYHEPQSISVEDKGPGELIRGY